MGRTTSRPAGLARVAVKARASGDGVGRAAPRLPKPLRIVRNHVRLFSSLAVGIATFAIEPLLPTFRDASLATRYLVAWDVFVMLYLALAIAVITRFDVALARRRAAQQDDGGFALLVLLIGTAAISLLGIGAELGTSTPDMPLADRFKLVVATITLSWIFVQVIFAFHYAHEYYDEGDEGGGLEFPQDPHPEYWDFLYFSVVIGMTFQVSDVQVISKRLRRLVMAHGLVSFVFNVAILALVVNFGSNLINASKDAG